MALSKITQLICTLLLFLLAWASSGPAWSSQQLILADIVDQLPSSIMAQRILRHAYKQLDVDVKFEILPNLRTKNLLESKAIDGLVFRLADSALFDLEKINVPITYEEFVVFSVNQQFKVSDYKSLQPYSIGYLTGAKIFEDKLAGMQVDTAPSLESLFQKLAAGRTDIIIESRSSFCKARKLGLNNINMLEPSLDKIMGYHWLSKRHGQLIPRLEAALKNMQLDGSIRRIQEKTWRDFNAKCATPAHK